MNRFFAILIFIITYSFSCLGQENNDAIQAIELTTISQVNQGNSYITFPTDIGNIEPLWFEGNLIPNFYIRQSKNSRLMGVVTPQVIIRMYQNRSRCERQVTFLKLQPIICLVRKLRLTV